MAVTKGQKRRVDGIIRHINDYLDKRFAQARRINPRVGVVEADIRWHQIETLRQVLEGSKSFGPTRQMVADILGDSDEARKRDLFNPVDQASIMNEIIPADEHVPTESRAGQLEIHDVRSFYRALDPSLEKMVQLIQSWIWWDLRDAADLYRFEGLFQRIETIKSRDLDQSLIAGYQQAMALPPERQPKKEEVIAFELKQLKEILDKFEERRRNEPGYQIIIVSREREGSPEADAACQRLARRLMVLEKVKRQAEPLDESVKDYYAGQLGVPADEVTPDRIEEWEERQARKDRQMLAEQLSQGRTMGQASSYKRMNLAQMKARYEQACHSLGAALEPSHGAPAHPAE